MSSPEARGLVWISCGAEALLPENSSRSAPRPTIPRQIRLRAGAVMTPRTGAPSVTSAMLTVYSSRPADEFARAVEGIDQEITAARGGLLVLRLLLRNDRQSRSNTRQALAR